MRLLSCFGASAWPEGRSPLGPLRARWRRCFCVEPLVPPAPVIRDVGLGCDCGLRCLRTFGAMTFGFWGCGFSLGFRWDPFASLSFCSGGVGFSFCGSGFSGSRRKEPDHRLVALFPGSFEGRMQRELVEIRQLLERLSARVALLRPL